MPVGKKGVTFYGEVTGSILTDVPSGKEASQPMYIPNTDLNQGCQAADVVLKSPLVPFWPQNIFLHFRILAVLQIKDVIK